MSDTKTETKTRTKTEIVQHMLARKNGVSLEQICEETGWKPHSARAFLSGLRKRGFQILRKFDDSKISHYTIADKPSAK